MTNVLNFRADLTAHGPIGFQPYWLRTQGYAGRNLIELFSDACAKRDIKICSVVSQADDMNGPYQDRFKVLCGQIKSLKAPYEAQHLGENSIFVTNRSKESPRGTYHTVILLNAQSVVMLDGDKKRSLTVVGTNKVPNLMTEAETMRWAADHPQFLYGAEHPFKTGSQAGVGRDSVMKNRDIYDFIDWDSQLPILHALTFLPGIGSQLAQYERRLNQQAKELARAVARPLVPGSNAHRFEDIGVSYIEIPRQELRFNSDGLVSSLKGAILDRRFKPHFGYENMVDWYKWANTFKTGLSRKSDE